MHEAGIDATQCDLTDFDAVQSALDDLGHVGALMLLDVIEHLTQPHELLAAPVGVVAEARRTAAWWCRAQRGPLRPRAAPAVRPVDPTETGPARQHPSPLLHRGDPASGCSSGAGGGWWPATTS